MGHGLVHECSRETGLPNGFALKYDVLSQLSKDECDVIVLPNLKYAPKEAVDEIRRLYNEGVNLVAVSDILPEELKVGDDIVYKGAKGSYRNKTIGGFLL